MRTFLSVGSIVLLQASALVGAGERFAPANPDLQPQARRVLEYIRSLEGKGILTGQEETANLNEHIEKVRGRTGRLPAIRGWDIRHNITDPIPEAIKAWTEQGQLITFGWHVGAPPFEDSYKNSKRRCDVRKCLTPGTGEHRSFVDKLDRMADRLEVLRDRKVPVLWRPWHEMNGTWFWWSKDGPESFRDLWVFTFDYFTHKRKLDNLIWVWSASFEPSADWYPGDRYVDVVGSDTYLSARDHDRWAKIHEQLKAIAPDKPAAITENDQIPDPAVLQERGIDFVWFLTWHSEWLDENPEAHLRHVYHHPYALTADELPDLRLSETAD